MQAALACVAAHASDFCALRLIEPNDIAENIIGVSRTTCGGIIVVDFPFFSTVSFSGFLPKIVRISIGSRRGSIDGFVTCDALSKILSQ